MLNLILAGVGGQGTVLASKLLAQAAINRGLDVRTAETIGMAQRGGSVTSHVRIGQDLYSPLVALDTADIILGMEPSEALRCLPYLKKGGSIVVSSKFIKPFTASLPGSTYEENLIWQCLGDHCKNISVIDGGKICDACGSTKVLNIALLGAASNLRQLNLTLVDLEKAVQEILPQKIHSINLQALNLGAQSARKGETAL